MNEAERLLLTLPGRFSGLALDNAVLTEKDHLLTSRRLTARIANQLESLIS